MAELRGKYHQIYKVGPNSLNVYLHIVNNDIDLVVVVTLLSVKFTFPRKSCLVLRFSSNTVTSRTSVISSTSLKLSLLENVDYKVKLMIYKVNILFQSGSRFL